jgi:lysyl-tRNA synthetase class 2
MGTLKELRDARLNKLHALQKLGIDPYTQTAKRTHTNAKLIESYDKLQDHQVSIVGRIKSIRTMGGMAFIDVVDASGKLQAYTSKQELQADYEHNAVDFVELKLLDPGDFIEASGKLTKTKVGEISVFAKTIRVLTKSLRPLPDEHEGFVNVDTRYRQRYVDMIVNPEVRRIQEVRAGIIQELRAYLDEQGFTEVETPVLQPVYGGASARPFTTHHHKLASDFFLRISDELYLKRAIVGGFERVFEIGRDFRNEGIDRSHNPEFTMLELYWAYADYEDLMKLTEEMFSRVIKKVHGKLSFEFQGETLDFEPPYRRVTFRDLVLEHTKVDIDTVSREELLAEIKRRKIEVDIKSPMKDLLDEFYKETTRPHIKQPLFLLDYPAEMSPLAKKKTDDPSKVASMQLLAAGLELIKAYDELNDPIDQLARLQTEEKVLKAGHSAEAQPIDYDFIRALEVGMPPTAGWGLGIDRFVLFLLDRSTLKETIMFPTLRPEKFNPKEFTVDNPEQAK